MPIVVFAATDATDGREIWRSDGTVVGTYQLADINPGPADSDPSNFVELGGIVYFTAFDGVATELWRTDGTTAGTYAVSTVSDGDNPTQLTPAGDNLFYVQPPVGLSITSMLFVVEPGHASPQAVATLSGAQQFIALGNELIFENSDSAHGSELWVSDGTVAGTHILDDIAPGSASSDPSSLAVFDGKVYFAANDGVDGFQLWATNGTTGGTHEIYTGQVGSYPSSIVSVGNHLVYVADAEYGNGLWASDGTSDPPTELIANFTVYNSLYAVLGGELYFQDNQASQPGLYVSDGTLSGTKLLAYGLYTAVAPIDGRYVLNGTDPQHSFGLYVSDGTPQGTTFIGETVTDLQNFVSFRGTTYFFFNGELWSSDGTVAGTQAVADIDGSGLTVSGDQLMFAASSDAYNNELWVSDGTAAGTHQLLEINPPTTDGSLGIVQTSVSDMLRAESAPFDGGLAFLGIVNGLNATPWISDGTEAGSVSLVTPSSNADFTNAADLTVSGSRLYFTATDSSGDLQLWSSSGTPGDLVMLTSNTTENLELGSDVPNYFTAFDGKLYFIARGVSAGDQWWVTDGTISGTTPVSSVTPVSQPIGANGKMIFFAGDSNGGGLYQSDGTAAGTELIADTGSAFEGAPTLVVSGSKIFFASDEIGVTGQELWVSDGTATGTHLVDDIAPGPADSDPEDLTAFDNGVVFTANDETHATEVWFSDGTAGGTFINTVNPTTNPGASLTLNTVYSGVYSSDASFDGKTFFIANDGMHGVEVWASDGTAAGTTMVTPGVGDLMPFDGKLFFVDDEQRPWVTDGTAAGSVNLSSTIGQITNPVIVGGDIYFEGVDSLSQGGVAFGVYASDGTVAGTQAIFNDQATGLAAAGDDLFFVSNDGVHGPGLYTYDTLSATTTFLSDVGAADTGGGPLGFTFGSKLFFAGDDGVHGVELWVSDGTAAGTQMVKDIESGSNSYDPTDFTVCNGQLYFTAGDYQGLLPMKPSIWVTDGTSAGTALATNLNGSSTLSGISLLTPDGSDLFFVATYYGGSGPQIWNYNTQTKSNYLAGYIYEGGLSDFVSNPIVAGGVLYFQGFDPADSAIVELFRANPAGGDTMLTTQSNGAMPSQFAALGTKLFFTAADSTHGQGLFVTDGTVAGTKFLVAMDGLNVGDVLSAINGKIYFRNADPTNGSELWVSDGTVAGTMRLTDTETPNSSNASDFTVSGSLIYFSATDGVHGQELWSFNGTPGSAQMVLDINPGDRGSNPIDLTAFDGMIYFAATNSVGATDLWRSVGTAASTVALSSSTNGGTPQDLTVVGANLIFIGSDSVHGSGLFVLSGAATSPTFLAAFSQANSFSVVGDELYFDAAVGGNGAELWKSDGTVAGTVQVTQTDYNPGSDPRGLTVVNPIFEAPSNAFDGAGLSDLLWRNANGDVGLWLTGSGGGYTPVDLGVIPTAWQIDGTADFNNDGKADILWRNSNGDVGVWMSNTGSGYAGFTSVDFGVIPNSWAIQGTGDFNGDGKSDILWRNTSGDTGVWLSNSGTGYTGFTSVDFGVIPTAWSIDGVGDFTGGAKSDILWRNSNGDVGLWLSNAGAGYTGTTSVDLGIIPTSWTIEGVGDFNGDGKADILWRNTNGDVGVWLSNAGTGYTGFTSVDFGVIDASWSIQSVGDYNDDGKADILWRNSNGDVGEWLSKPGSGYTGFTAVDLGTIPASWQITDSTAPAAPPPNASLFVQTMASMANPASTAIATQPPATQPPTSALAVVS